jgi:hypothetical protein
MFNEIDGIKREIADLEQVRRPTSQKLFEGARKAILNGDESNALFRQCIKNCEIDFKKGWLDVYGHDGNSIYGVVLKDDEEVKKAEAKRKSTSGRRSK